MIKYIFLLIALFVLCSSGNSQDFGFKNSGGDVYKNQVNVFTADSNVFKIVHLDSLFFKANTTGAPDVVMSVPTGSSFIGANENALLVDPNVWLSVNVKGTLYLIPLYTKP